MTVTCEHASTCNAAMYCTHAKPHEPILPWKANAIKKMCDYNHACDYTCEVVKCEPVK